MDIPESTNTEVKDRIVNLSFVRFISKGYRATSLKELEQITGLTKGAFYYYFRNKEEILRAGIDRYLYLLRDIEEEELNRVGSLREYIELELKCKEENARLIQQEFGSLIIEVLFFQLVLEVEPLFPHYREQINILSKNRLARWEYIILKAKQNGEIRSGLDTSVLARNLMSVSGSMLNIGLDQMDLMFHFSDMRMQFEQYYMLIRR